MSYQGGVSRSNDVRLRWWEVEPVPPQLLRRSSDGPEDPIRVSVNEVLNYFEKCPQCGYPAHASATVRIFRGGSVETMTVPSCGLPCGWQGKPQVFRVAGPVVWSD